MATADEKPIGFAALSPDQHAKVSAKGGRAKAKRPKGLAALSPEERKAISAKGGKARAEKAAKAKRARRRRKPAAQHAAA